MTTKKNYKEDILANSSSNYLLPMVVNFQRLYLQEVMTELNNIEKTVSKIKIEKNNQEYLSRVRDRAQSISDLAMIHGFEGVEKISEKLYSTVKLLLVSSIDLNKSILSKIKMAVKVIKQVARMETDIEKQMTVEKISKAVERNQKKVQNCAVKFSKSIDDLMSNQPEVTLVNDAGYTSDTINIQKKDKKKDSKLVFDISEQESVLNLADKS